MLFAEKTKGQLEYLRRLKTNLEKRLKSMPEGNLRRKKTRNRIYYYVKDGVRERSLNNLPQLRDIYIEKQWVEGQLKIIKRDIPVMEQFLRDYAPLFPSPLQWEMLEAEKNSFKREEKKHYYNGVYFRSKSEVVVAMVLESLGLEFKYETELRVKGRNIYPDFVIRRKRDGKIFIWEHFGLISNDEYRQKMYRRLEELHEAGFNLWDNLLISFDSEDGSIDVDFVERMVKLYLL